MEVGIINVPHHWKNVSPGESHEKTVLRSLLDVGMSLSHTGARR